MRSRTYLILYCSKLEERFIKPLKCLKSDCMIRDSHITHTQKRVRRSMRPRQRCHKMFFPSELYCHSHMAPESPALTEIQALKVNEKTQSKSINHSLMAVSVAVADPQRADSARGLRDRVHLQRKPGDRGT